MKPDYAFATPSDVNVAALAARLPPSPLTRFAPAPTGVLHLGHVVNALYVWSIARLVRARVLLRIEDHDRDRCRSEFEAAILEDLDWLGFAPDQYPTSAFRGGGCAGRQSDREHEYREAAARLRAGGLVYACRCSRREIAGAAGGETTERVYPGTCRDAQLPIDEGAGWRVRIDAGVERFDDARLGPQAQEPASQGGDVLIRDRRGNWTYQFAAAVDDWQQSIDLVIRGEDLLASTGRQMRIARLLGRTQPPVFLHHPLLMKSPGQKLSKSDGDTGIRDLRARGWTRDDVLRHAASWLATRT